MHPKLLYLLHLFFSLVLLAMARFLLLLPFLLVALASRVSAADSMAATYWRSIFPDTHMLTTISDLIYSASGKSFSSIAYRPTPFLEKSLQTGSTMVVNFKHEIAGSLLLHSQVADSIPFSSSKLPEILARLSIDPSSKEASAIKDTLAECEADALPNQIKQCATSLESMVDFAISGLKSSSIQVMSTSIGKTANPRQKYTITGFNKVKASEFVVCHAEAYAYTVYRCHTLTAKAYTVSLVGADGTKVQAVATCHSYAAMGGDAEVMSYGEFASRKLGVDPTSVPVCHFLRPQDDLLWSKVRSSQLA